MLLALAAVLAATALAPAGASAIPTGAIEGTVTGTDTLEGIEGVEVCATRYEPTFIESCALTAAEGIYAIEGLAAGSYELAFYGRSVGYRSEFLPESVIVGTEPVTGVDAELDPQSEITGTVTRSADGAPLEGVEVCAWGLSSDEWAGCTNTEADGTYVLEEVEPGEYGVEFWPYETGQNLIGEVYDNHLYWSEADPVVVEEGESVGGIDAALDPGATISGHVYKASTGVPLEEIPVCAIEVVNTELWSCDWTRADGSYELPFLVSGQYKVVFSIDFEEWYEEEFEEEESDGYPTEFWNEQTTLAAANIISVANGQNVTGIDDRLDPLASQPLSNPPASVQTPTITPPVAHRPKRCRKGFKRKKVHGKVRCVKRRKHHHRHRHASRPLELPSHLHDR